MPGKCGYSVDDELLHDKKSSGFALERSPETASASLIQCVESVFGSALPTPEVAETPLDSD